MEVPMFKKILIANRGEIAVRVMRTCRDLGIRAVAVYSEADREALHVRFADEAYFIGPPAPRESYLNVARLVEVIRASGADAVHPGYGFLSENADFARAVAAAGAKFIGPSPEAIHAMGSKTGARQLMMAAGVPVVPGGSEAVADVDAARAEAMRVGYPVLLKARSGGGGRGMRIVKGDAELASALASGTREAASAFGDGGIYVEKYFGTPKHVEVQVLADSFGETVHLFERDCSVQRRHQKVIEESPCAVVDDEARRAIGDIAVGAA
jgi:acetyl/propionyl-CoA carboxylase alpha subunit